MVKDNQQVDANVVDAWRAFLTASVRCLTNIDTIFAENDLIPTEVYDVLVTLEYADGHRLRMADLAKRTLFTPSGLTRLVDRLVHQGLVSRESCTHDRRGLMAVLTPAGQQARERAWPFMREEIMRTFGANLTEAESVAMAKFFWAVVQRAEAYVG